MTRLQKVLLSLLSGVLLSFAWLPFGHGGFALVGLTPLLWIEYNHTAKKKENQAVDITTYAFMAFLTWNILTTFWIYYTSPTGMAIVMLLNSLFMTFVFYMGHLSKRILGRQTGGIAMVLYWLALEHFYLHSQLSWPWLNLGNAFANQPNLVQWYEYTGVEGGSLWIWLVNLSIVGLARAFYYKSNKLIARALFLALLTGIPLWTSFSLHADKINKQEYLTVAVLQPNIDPFTTKFSSSQEKQLKDLLELADNIASTKTDYILGPETAIHDTIWLDSLSTNEHIQQLRNFAKKHPHITLVTGIETMQGVGSANKTPELRLYNSAIQMDTSLSIPVYHKSKLVAGVESIPYPKVFGFLSDLQLELGGTQGLRGRQKERTTFRHSQKPVRIAPVICFESIYGEHVNEFVAQGANIIFIMTNDGWLKSSVGYQQHFSFARLRAIETRRTIARSANTGISGFIAANGDILSTTEKNTKTAIDQIVPVNNSTTFYVIHGDFIGRLSAFLAIISLLYTLVVRKTKKYDS